MDYNLDDLLEGFNTVSKKPYGFLSVQENLSESIKTLLKNIYDYTKCNEDTFDKRTLSQLVISGFDDEQIWQEIELQNGVFTDNTIESVSQLSAKGSKLTFPLKLKSIKDDSESASQLDHLEDNENFENNDDQIESENEDTDGFASESENENSVVTKFKKRKLKPSVVDDKFFKLSELELFLQNEEKKEENPDKETLDLFENSNDGIADYKYSDFFDNPNEDLDEDGQDGSFAEDDEDDQDEDIDGNDDFEVDDNKSDETSNVKASKKRKISKTDNEISEDEGTEQKGKSKKVRFSLLDSDQSGGESSEEPIASVTANKKEKKSDHPKSSFEQRQERLGRMIEKLEDEALSEKPWQMIGEITANSRPQNSLLEEVVDFDLSVRPAPVMTEEVTMRLEDIIKLRIKDKAWDDVERKIKPVDTPSEFKKKLALDQEKSKLSLAEVYEQEFIKQREAATGDDTERQEKEPPLHGEVRAMLSSLFNKLDALSNYHYTPRPVAPELKIVSNVAAIMMEEVAPVATADSALLAPEEIKSKKRESQLMSKEERTATDKKRARRIKKTKQRQRQRDKEKRAKDIAKLNPGLGNKYSRSKADKELLDVTKNVTKMEESRDKSIKSSTAFFDKLQDEVKSQIKTKTYAKKKDKRILTAKKLKL